MIDLSFVIVSFNTKDFLQKCLRSLYDKKSRYTFEIIVVDNASVDGSQEMVLNEFPKVVLIQNRENVGFSKANNIGVKKTTGRYVLFLNSDTEATASSLDTMVDFMDSHKDAGAATCALFLPNGKLDDASHRGFPTPLNSLFHFSGIAKLFPRTKFFSGYSLGHLDQQTTHEIDSLAGAFMITRRQAGEEVSWWDEDYFFYGEDIDFCYRLKEKGWKIYFVPTVSVLHYKGVSGGIKKSSQHLTTATKETKEKITNARFNAMKIFYKKHYEKKYPMPLTWLILQGVELKRQISLRQIS